MQTAPDLSDLIAQAEREVRNEPERASGAVVV